MSALPKPIPSPERPALSVRCRGLVDYTTTWKKMQGFTDMRTAETPDELWLLQHSPVFTLGRNGKTEHLLHHTGDIPVIHVDRGGQVT
jgi:lipoyl(octanoyl) transferase